jgi:hypothetical protein
VNGSEHERGSVRRWLVPTVAVTLGVLALLSLRNELETFRYRASPAQFALLQLVDRCGRRNAARLRRSAGV